MKKFILIIFITFGLLISGCSNDVKDKNSQFTADINIEPTIESSSTSLSNKKFDYSKNLKSLEKKKSNKKLNKKTKYKKSKKKSKKRYRIRTRAS